MRVIKKIQILKYPAKLFQQSDIDKKRLFKKQEINRERNNQRIFNFLFSFTSTFTFIFYVHI